MLTSAGVMAAQPLGCRRWLREQWEFREIPAGALRNTEHASLICSLSAEVSFLEVEFHTVDQLPDLADLGVAGRGFHPRPVVDVGGGQDAFAVPKHLLTPRASDRIISIIRSASQLRR